VAEAAARLIGYTRCSMYISSAVGTAMNRGMRFKGVPLRPLLEPQRRPRLAVGPSRIAASVVLTFGSMLLAVPREQIAVIGMKQRRGRLVARVHRRRIRREDAPDGVRSRWAAATPRHRRNPCERLEVVVDDDFAGQRHDPRQTSPSE